MEDRRGYLYGLAAYLSWGFFPIYFKHLQPSGPGEILAHRVVWSAAFVAVLLFALRRWRAVRGLAREPRRLGGVLLAAAVIAVNWGTYIYGVNTDRVVETSLGYFINPLISVLFGVVLLGERLRRWQWTALGVGGVAVAVLTVDYGRLPYIALTLAVSFATYGLIKKRLGLPPADGLFVESAALALPALGYLAVLASRGADTVGAVSPVHTTLVLLGGVITAIPLLMFAAAANRIPMTGLGILQYTAPILQLAVGVFLYHEPMPPARLAGFTLVWLALAIFTWDAINQTRRQRSRSPATDGLARRPLPAWNEGA
jgi:chloramphenicol-sensitive protein RarD